jgi:hypothetical protein
VKTLGVRNWRKFQHYSKRRPPWIKFYADLLDDREFQALPKEAKLLYPLLLLVASRKENDFPSDERWIAAELAIPLADVRKGMGALLASGFIVNGDSGSAR